LSFNLSNFLFFALGVIWMKQYIYDMWILVRSLENTRSSSV
jgi:hypothetical protein